MTQSLTVLEVVQRSAAFLEGKGVESARLNAEWLIASALQMDRMKLYMQFDRPLTDAELSKMRAMVARRGKREPLQYILGTAPFHEITLKVDERALIPRPETEQLVERALTDLGDNGGSYRILDMGTGSGAIALALAFSLPQAEIVALDKSEAAIELAKENAFHCGMQNRVTFLVSDWFSGLEESATFDMIVANPPYLTEEEMESAEPEVTQHEPVSALVAEESGLADLKAIAQGAFGRLEEGGSLWLETGINHRTALVELCESLGFRSVEGLDDWSGRPRFVHGVR